MRWTRQSDDHTGTIAFTSVIGVSSCRSHAKHAEGHAFLPHRLLISGSNNRPCIVGVSKNVRRRPSCPSLIRYTSAKTHAEIAPVPPSRLATSMARVLGDASRNGRDRHPIHDCGEIGEEFVGLHPAQRTTDLAERRRHKLDAAML